jgi:hypothetical protein
MLGGLTYIDLEVVAATNRAVEAEFGRGFFDEGQRVFVIEDLETWI